MNDYDEDEEVEAPDPVNFQKKFRIVISTEPIDIGDIPKKIVMEAEEKEGLLTWAEAQKEFHRKAEAALMELHIRDPHIGEDGFRCS